MIFADTSFEKLCVRQADHEGMAGATRRAPLAPDCREQEDQRRAAGCPAGSRAAPQYVDKTERHDRSFLVERRRIGPRNGAGARRSLPAQPTEDQIQITVIEWLQRRGVPGLHFFHVPNGGLRNKAVAAKLKAMGVRPGEPDVILLYRGRVYGLELKAAGGRQSSDQEIIEREWERAGATYAVAHGLDYALATLRLWGLLE